MLIIRRAEFSASHTCWNPALDAAANAALYGEEARARGHGHNFVVEVGLEGEPDAVTGMIVDLKHVKQIIEEEILAPMDHRHLNHEVPPFDHLIPTPENLVLEIWRRLAPRFERTPARLARVRLYETDDLWVEYEGR
jgi:6-pyruvoyltetrahydropterin/6-carboxytetrahydropterin synthase